MNKVFQRPAYLRSCEPNTDDSQRCSKTLPTQSLILIFYCRSCFYLHLIIPPRMFYMLYSPSHHRIIPLEWLSCVRNHRLLRLCFFRFIYAKKIFSFMHTTTLKILFSCIKFSFRFLGSRFYEFIFCVINLNCTNNGSDHKQLTQGMMAFCSSKPKAPQAFIFGLKPSISYAICTPAYRVLICLAICSLTLYVPAPKVFQFFSSLLFPLVRFEGTEKINTFSPRIEWPRSAHCDALNFKRTIRRFETATACISNCMNVLILKLCVAWQWSQFHTGSRCRLFCILTRQLAPNCQIIIISRLCSDVEFHSPPSPSAYTESQAQKELHRPWRRKWRVT